MEGPYDFLWRLKIGGYFFYQCPQIGELNCLCSKGSKALAEEGNTISYGGLKTASICGHACNVLGPIFPGKIKLSEA